MMVPFNGFAYLASLVRPAFSVPLARDLVFLRFQH